jgi:hypothetical protein
MRVVAATVPLSMTPLGFNHYIVASSLMRIAPGWSQSGGTCTEPTDTTERSPRTPTPSHRAAHLRINVRTRRRVRPWWAVTALRVRVEIMGSQKCRIAGNLSQFLL